MGSKLKIEATGNTEVDARYVLTIKREALWDRYDNVVFDEVTQCYGDFEKGYKVVQYYRLTP